MNITLAFLEQSLTQCNTTSFELKETKDHIECNFKDLESANSAHAHLSKALQCEDSSFYEHINKQEDGSFQLNINKDLIKEKIARKLNKIFKDELNQQEFKFLPFAFTTFKNDLDKNGNFKTPFVALNQQKKLTGMLNLLGLQQVKDSSVSTIIKNKTTYFSLRVKFKLKTHFITLLCKPSDFNQTKSPKLSSTVQSPVSQSRLEIKSVPKLPDLRSETKLSNFSSSSLFQPAQPLSPSANFVSQTPTLPDSKTTPQLVEVKPSRARCVIL